MKRTLKKPRIADKLFYRGKMHDILHKDDVYYFTKEHGKIPRAWAQVDEHYRHITYHVDFRRKICWAVERIPAFKEGNVA